MKKIDLNADIAEGFPFDEALLKLLSSANIACGLHAGGAKEMQSADVYKRQLKFIKLIKIMFDGFNSKTHIPK